MIKAIIFDFDGIIVESSDIKTEAFRELFKDYPEKIETILNYHLLRAGISRYIKFRHIYRHILGQRLSEDKERQLGKHFSQLILEKILAAPLVTGTKEFLDKSKSRYQFFIASGTPQEELHNIVCAKDLRSYFKEIHGSPREKKDIINSIIQRYDFSNDDVIYVGDAESDCIAARESGVVFIERRAGFEKNTVNNPWTIRDLSSLDVVLQKLEAQRKETVKE